MNKKMREIFAKMKNLQEQAEKHLEAGNSTELNEVLAQIQDLQAAYNTEKALYEIEKSGVSGNGEAKDKDITGFSVIAKMLQKKPLTDAENAMIVGGSSGEDNLVPTDVDLTIREARKTYQSLKDYVTVYPTATLKGTNVYATATDSELTSFDDGDTLTDSASPSFATKSWAIGFYGNTFPVSNILMGAEQAGLMAYINRHFLRKAITTENKAIITALKKDKTAVAIKGLSGLRKQINTALDDSYMVDAIILTNHTGFEMLDSETDAIGRPMLNRNPVDPTDLRYMGLPVVKVSDTLLPNETGGAAPIFFGSLKAGITFYDYMQLQFAISEHALFSKNQTAMRIIEGFTVMQEYADAYVYGKLTADDEKVVTTKAKASA